MLEHSMLRTGKYSVVASYQLNPMLLKKCTHDLKLVVLDEPRYMELTLPCAYHQKCNRERNAEDGIPDNLMYIRRCGKCYQLQQGQELNIEF
mmetsp:Transcript_18908/g.27288  ORF Transcript_18908/g.27288 Transcript_18908/m.27288 type:complete len:92 (-) Transcript_18908:772-1047(-)